SGGKWLQNVLLRRLGALSTLKLKRSGPQQGLMVPFPSHDLRINRLSFTWMPVCAGRPPRVSRAVSLVNSPRNFRAPTGVDETVVGDHSVPAPPSKVVA